MSFFPSFPYRLPSRRRPSPAAAIGSASVVAVVLIGAASVAAVDPASALARTTTAAAEGQAGVAAEARPRIGSQSVGSPSVGSRSVGSPSDCRPRWRQPVGAPIVDGFRPPNGPFGPGNRGFEYGTAGGEPVEPVADGTVGFAAPVGGRWYVVVEHRETVDPATGLPLRSTYGPVDGVVVGIGDRVEVGRPFARAAHEFHLTARVGDRYQDPGPLLRGSCRGPRLVAIGG